MKKVEFMTTTKGNNKFQTIMSKQLEQCGTNTNDYLKIVRFSNKTILVSSAANKNFEKAIATGAKVEGEKLFLMVSDLEESSSVLKLNPSQVRMFEYLKDRGLIDGDWHIKPLKFDEIDTI
jgi:hypothetical protein